MRRDYLLLVWLLVLVALLLAMLPSGAGVHRCDPVSALPWLSCR